MAEILPFISTPIKMSDCYKLGILIYVHTKYDLYPKKCEFLGTLRLKSVSQPYHFDVVGTSCLRCLADLKSRDSPEITNCRKI